MIPKTAAHTTVMTMVTLSVPCVDRKMKRAIANRNDPVSINLRRW